MWDSLHYAGYTPTLLGSGTTIKQQALAGSLVTLQQQQQLQQLSQNWLLQTGWAPVINEASEQQLLLVEEEMR